MFEPVSVYADIIKQRFQKNEKIRVYAMGLAEKDSEAVITVDKFSSRISSARSTSKPTEVKILLNLPGSGMSFINSLSQL